MDQSEPNQPVTGQETAKPAETSLPSLPKLKLPKLSELPLRLKLRLNEYRRVFKITKKPTMEEFKTVSKVSAIGTLIIGAIGFVIYIIIQYII